MTNSQLFKAAHQVARNLQGDYRARFAMALKIVRNQAQHIQFIKNLVLDVNSHYSRTDVTGDVYECFQVVGTVGMFTNGFASQVATTVNHSGRCSEKQAYVIARGYIEAGCDAGIMSVWFASKVA